MTNDSGDLQDYTTTDMPDNPPRNRRRLVILLAVIVVLLGSVGIALQFFSDNGLVTHPGPEGVPVPEVVNLASANTAANGQTIDGIPCRYISNQSVSVHLHVHVAIYVNGQLERLPAGIGISTPKAVTTDLNGNGLFIDAGAVDCLYLLHTHADDGIIHVESPTKGNYTLGQFFDIWRQPLTPDQVGPAKGSVAAFINGKRFSGNPRDIVFSDKAAIQLDIGSPIVRFQPVHINITGSCSASEHGCTIG